MKTDDDLQRRFDAAKIEIDLEPRSSAEVRHRAMRRTRNARILSTAAVLTVVAAVGVLAFRGLPNGSSEINTAGPATTVLPSPTPSGTTVLPAPAAVIFESDFSQDTGYRVGFTNLWNGAESDPVEPPVGWDGVKVGSTDGEFAVIDGEGVDGSNALRISWGGESQPTVSLGKHLTGDETTGYDELYVRYRVRFPNNLTFGSGDGNFGSWTWGRLWQNTSVDGDGPNAWTENRANSGSVAFAFNNGIPFTSASGTWAENIDGELEIGDDGRPRQRVDWFVDGSEPSTQAGYFESVWDINTTDRPGELEGNQDQGWHTIEFHFKLAASPTSDDGVFEVFFDGVSQGTPTVIAAAGGAPERTGIPTANLGSGFNFLTFFDHVQFWNAQWDDPDVDGYIWVNDVVVSTDRIGDDYSSG